MEQTAAIAAGRQYLQVKERYEHLSRLVGSTISDLCRAGRVDVDSITHRAKTEGSVIAKLQRENRYASLEQITDKAGARVITRYAADVDEVCSLITTHLNVIEDTRHGEEEVEVFGYSSRHLLVRPATPYETFVVEVQVRSVLQHAWAVISHSLDYKSSLELPPPVRRRLYRVAGLLQTSDELFDSFRREVEELTHSYREQVTGGEWGGLPLDLYSGREALHILPLAELSAEAVSQGWRRSREDSREHVPLSRLIQTAAASDLQSLEELGGLAERVLADKAWLGRIAASSRRRIGSAPAAIPTDILTLRILSERPSDLAASAAKAAMMNDFLVDISLEIPPSVGLA